jgi:hypothetical protein
VAGVEHLRALLPALGIITDVPAVSTIGVESFLRG